MRRVAEKPIWVPYAVENVGYLDHEALRLLGLVVVLLVDWNLRAED